VSYGHFGTSAEMSWVRSVLGPKCLDTLYSRTMNDFLNYKSE